METQALVLRRVGDVPRLETIRIDTDLEPGQVLVEIHFAGLCATQLEEIFHARRTATYIPHLLGHEAFGSVRATGSAVQSLKPDDKCIIHWRSSSEKLDANPGKYYSGGSRINAGKVVAFANLVVLPENRVTKVPRAPIPDFVMPLLGCAFPTGWGAVMNDGQVRQDDHVLVLGLGGVGLFAAETAQSFGVASLTVVDPVRSLRGRVGMDASSSHFDSLAHVPMDHLESVTLVIDTTGLPDLVELVVDRVSRNARVVLVGMPAGGQKTLIATQKLLDGLRLLGSNGGGVDFSEDLDSMVEAMSRSNFTDNGFGIGVFDPNDLELAIDSHKRGDFRRVVLDFSRAHAMRSA